MRTSLHMCDVCNMLRVCIVRNMCDVCIVRTLRTLRNM